MLTGYVQASATLHRLSARGIWLQLEGTRMSLQIAVAHTGQRLDADLVGFNSIDQLKEWIANATNIPAASQILLTPRGKHVKLQALLTEVRAVLCLFELHTNSCVTERDIYLQS